MSFVDELSWHGLVHQQTDSALSQKMAAARFTVYAGFDPTADSLHVGSLLPMLGLVRAQRAGHRPIALVGGATGLIGDPSGKSAERSLLSKEQLSQNLAGIRRQLERVLDFSGTGGALLVDNAEWFAGYQYLDFLRDVGKHFSVNAMMARDSVRARLEDREQGISYTEFSYMLIQAYDFLALYRQHKCALQIGGSDQWGNITSGIDLIRRLEQGEAYGLTMPLVMTSAGTKFGKTEKGTVWLDAARTSPYEFYQFFIQTDDRDVGKFLRYYTFLDEKTILALEETMKAAPEKREAQKMLAGEVTTLVHGAEETKKAEGATGALFSGELTSLDASAIASMFGDAPSSMESRAALEGAGLPLIATLAKTGLCQSNGQARKDIQGGGIYVNSQRVDDIAFALKPEHLLAGKFVVLRKGKKTFHLLKVE